MYIGINWCTMRIKVIPVGIKRFTYRYEKVFL